MASTTFVDRQTPIVASWLNDVNEYVYENNNRERISVIEYLTDAEITAVYANDSSADVSTNVRAAIAAGAGKDVYFPGPATYYMATTSGDAYITLSTAGTRLILGRNAKIRFLDTAAYGINITAQLCDVNGGLLWGTNTTAPTLTAMVNVTMPNCKISNCNIAYAVFGTYVNDGYIIWHKDNSYSWCDCYFYTEGSTAHIFSSGNSYGTTTIGSRASVIITGAGGADLHDYWETMIQSKLALQCVTGTQRVQCRGKFFDSGGIEVQNSVYLRLDAELTDSYTGTIGVDIKSGGTVDATGSRLAGPGITSGVECFNVDGNIVMGSGFITGWQVAGDINANASIGDVTVAQCTTGWDVFGDARGKIGPCFYSGVTTPIVRATATLLSMLDAFTGSATFNPTSLVDGAGETTTITVTGARLGDSCEVSFSNDLQGILMSSWVTNDTVNVRFQNETGGTIDLAEGTLRARVNTKII
jgi:hypothetical protein